MNSVTYTPNTDPAIIELEDSFATPHRVYMMKVFGSEIADKRKLDQWRHEGKYGLGLGGGTDPIPASFICSDGDHLIPFKECKEFASFLQIPDHRFHVVERCGHKIMLEAPGRVVDIILSDLPLKSKL